MSVRRDWRMMGLAGLALACSSKSVGSEQPAAGSPAPVPGSGTSHVSSSSPDSASAVSSGSDSNAPNPSPSSSDAQGNGSAGSNAPTGPGSSGTSTDRETESITQAPGATGATSDASEPGPGAGDELGVRIVERAIYVDGRLFHLKGVNWNPVGKGDVHPDGLDFAGYADQDIALMKAAGINAVRTYERLEDKVVLDKLHAAGIYVFSTVLGWWQDDVSVVTARVNAIKDHPAILAWVLGNEWNYNQLYSEGQLSNAQVQDKLNQAAALIKAADPHHPVATIYGELGDIESAMAAMPEIDLWGINAYRGKDHAALFTQWQQLSTKPMFLGEYGADAWDSRDGGKQDLAAQAEATTELTQQLIDAYTTADGAGVASGGFIFEWADEWWKAGNPETQDNGGQAPGAGPYPDGTFNEEWWGIVDIDRNPRPAYEALKALYL